MERIICVSAGLLLGLAVTVPAYADMRCGTAIISEGDSVLRLLDACGEPTLGDRALYLGDAVWTYNFGPTEFMKRVRIRDGVIRRIETLGRGVVEPVEELQQQS